MTSQAAQVLPSSKFTRGNFGFSSKSRKTSENDEDWYIPYNGPYEAPPVRRKARDSWGDLVEPDGEEDIMVLNDKELHLRYKGYNIISNNDNGGRHVEEERIGRSKDATFSFISGRTVSSSSVGPTRPSMNRRSTVSTGTRPVMPSYINLDAVGGVGESPIPPRRSPKDGKRMNLPGIFNIGAQHRKPATSTERVVLGAFERKLSLLQRSNIRTGIDPPTHSSSPDHHPNQPLVMLQSDRFSSNTTAEDHYNSYYSTAHQQRSEPALNHNYRHHHGSPPLSEDSHHSHQPPFDQSSLNHQTSSSTSSGHPYALATPRTDMERSSTAPPPSNLPRLTFTAPSHKYNLSSVDHSDSLTRFANPKLKISNSTPDMRNSAIHGPVITSVPSTKFTPQRMPTPRFVFPKSKDRLFSAETWCDALIFPRPRLKNAPSGTTIVSPLDSPLGPDYIGSTGKRELGVASRVLAHSRSLVDFNRQYSSVSHGQDPPTARGGSSKSRFPQLTSGVKDDLALLTPVPPLAYVLEQREILANERDAWRLQAQASLGNKRTRTLSKTRSKSLTQQGRRRGHQIQSSMEYLASRAVLGIQKITATPSPTVTAATYTNSSHQSSHASSSRKASHSHNASLAKTLSKSSKSHSKNHSKGDSWSKSAVKLAQSTPAICGIPVLEDEVTVPKEVDVGAAKLDSDNCDQEVGIALGTPPPHDDEDDSFYVPSHPYARGGLSFSVPVPASNQTRVDRGTDFAGPHPSIHDGGDIPQISDILARHKLPPHLLLHPYAQASARDTYIEQHGLRGQFRSGDETPHQMKMWAQLSPEVLREILPSDFQYSPFSDKKDVSPTGSGDHIYFNDTVGVGETLVNAPRFCRSQDSSIGTNDSDVLATESISRDNGSQNILPELGSRMNVQPAEYNLALSENSQAIPTMSLTNKVASTSHTLLSIPLPDRTDSSMTSPSSSPYIIRHHLGTPNDLESFHDLFYRPNNNLRQSNNEPALPDSPPNIVSAAWNRNIDRHRTESGLTSLAHQLSREVELMSLERGMSSSSQYSSQPSSIGQGSSSISRRPTEGSLRFIFEDASQSGWLEHSIHAFRASDTLPEDVQSSRASSVIEKTDVEDEENTAVLRLGVVESRLTPPSMPPEQRPSSCTGETANNEGRSQDQSELAHMSGEVHGGTFSRLRPPSSEAIRSSFMTTSTVSRMSNLSDFPAPPKNSHMSLHAYFTEDLDQDESPSEDTAHPESEVIFGSNQDAGDLAKTLSSSS